MRRRRPRQPTTSSAKVSFFDSQTNDLQHIKDSVERLRAQRTHVEQLRRHTERLEATLAERARENDKLRLQVASLVGVEQENKGLLKSFQLLEERIRTLESTCTERKEDVRVANERAAAVERDRDRLQLQLDELTVDRDHLKKQLAATQATIDQRVEQAVKSHEKALDKSRRLQSQWQAKVKDLQQSHTQVEHKFQDELGLLRQENHKLVRKTSALETQVQQLLATTVRQTTMIEDCDCALSESRQQHATAVSSHREQVELNAKLKERLAQAEAKLNACEQEFIVDKHTLEKKHIEMEICLQKRKDKCDLYSVALQEKENLVEKLQNELLVRDRTREHVDEVTQDLRQQEKALRAEISELQVALSDMTDERNIAHDQLRAMKNQLEKERKDRSRWATARLKLLAEFCDEEHKLHSALHRRRRSPLDLIDNEELLDEESMEDGLLDEDDSDNGDVAAVASLVHATTGKMNAVEDRVHNTVGFVADRARRMRHDSKTIVYG